MDLLLWRHAEAAPGIPDLDRVLTARGEQQARAVARWLAKHAPADLRILVSPARRTRQTIEAWRDDYELAPEIGVSASGQGLLKAACWPQAGVPVLLVGHQPSLGEAAAILLSGRADDLAVKKGALWWFQRRMRDGHAHVGLKTVISASML